MLVGRNRWFIGSLLALSVSGCEKRDPFIPIAAGIVTASRTADFSDWSEPVSLGPIINGPYNDQHPALSKDGLSLFFASNRPGFGGNDIWVSHRDCLECPWQEPVNLGPPVNTDIGEAGPVLSRDEHWLFFFSARPGTVGSSDIWAAWRADVHDDFAWQTPVNLGTGVNTTGFEGGPGYFENDDGDGAQLFFNRNPAPVGNGGDIYVSRQAEDGTWGTAVPVAELNSAASDQRPSIAFSGLEIFFFSDRPGSMSNDIWHATRQSVLERWGAPTNLGAPINTAVGEVHPFIYSHGRTQMLFFARNMATPPTVEWDLFVSTRTRDGHE